MKKIFVFILVLLSIPLFAQYKFPSYDYSEGFAQAVTFGRIPGISYINKYGVNPLVTNATDPEDIWEFGGEYIFDPDSTAPIKYISSSNASDNEPILIEGLDSLGNEISQIIPLNGQNNSNLLTPLWRVYRMTNVGDTDLIGNVYCHIANTTILGVPDSDSVRAYIQSSNNQTLMTIYTIPKGKVGYFYQGELGISFSSVSPAIAQYATCQYQSRRYGSVFTTKKEASMIASQGWYVDTRSFPDPIPSLTDIRARVLEVSADMGLWASFDILLVDESMFPASFLHSIAQPGY